MNTQRKIGIAWIMILAWISCPIAYRCVSAQTSLMPDSTIILGTNAAYQHIYAVMDKYHTRFDVYSDQDAAGNHFIPDGFMGDWQDIVTFDTDCLDDPHSGITCIKVTYSAAGSQGNNWAGVYWLSGIRNWGDAPGYNLSGASKMTFWAKGAQGGEQVEFVVGGINRGENNDAGRPYQDSFGPKRTKRITLAREWRNYTIDLRGEQLDNVLGGFCFVTNIHMDPRGCTFYLDDIQYDKERLNDPRFLTSYETTSDCEDRVLMNAAFAYDNSLASLAFLARNNPDDYQRATIIANSFVLAQSNDRHYDDGRLRNTYQSGDLLDAFTRKARLPGWWDATCKKWLEDRGHVGTSAGNLAWVIISLLEYYGANKDSVYSKAACRLGHWIEINCRDARGSGGYTGGYDGWEPSPTNPRGQTKVAWKSTEHNIDIYAAFTRLYQITGDTVWQAGARNAETFVQSMWDSSGRHFWTGTLEDGISINKQSIPVDVQAWAVLAFGPSSLYTSGVYWAETNCLVEVCPKGCAYKGFDFNEDRDGVWMEGTAQMCLAYQMLGNYARSNEILQTLMSAQLHARQGNGKGMIAACHDSVSTGFDWVYYARLHVAATAWFIFASEHYNPYWGTSTGAGTPTENAPREIK